MLQNNAYHVLGLDTASSLKEINSRSKEIINRLKIDQVPHYDQDFDLLEGFRTESAVKDATQRLRTPKQKIIEYFFWFQIVDADSQNAFELLRANKDAEGLNIWIKAAQNKDGKSYIIKKNLAVYYCFLLSKSMNETLVDESLMLWKDLIHSEDFWENFLEMYKETDEQTASPEVISGFKDRINSHLSNLYLGLYELHNNSYVINKFHEVFGAGGVKVERNVLDPLLNSVNDLCQRLKTMDISADGVFDNDERRELKSLLTSIQDHCNELIDLGLYENENTRVIRDRAAQALRDVVIDLHNNIRETTDADAIHMIALTIAGTPLVRKKLEEERKIFDKMLRRDFQRPLDSKELKKLLINHSYGGVVRIIKERESTWSNDRVATQYFRNMIKRFVLLGTGQLIEDGIRKLLRKRADHGLTEFSAAEELFLENASFFYLDRGLINRNFKAISDLPHDHPLNTFIPKGYSFAKFRNEFIHIGLEGVPMDDTREPYTRIMESRFLKRIVELYNPRRKKRFQKFANIQIIVLLAVFGIISLTSIPGLSEEFYASRAIAVSVWTVSALALGGGFIIYIILWGLDWHSRFYAASHFTKWITKGPDNIHKRYQDKSLNEYIRRNSYVDEKKDQRLRFDLSFLTPYISVSTQSGNVWSGQKPFEKSTQEKTHGMILVVFLLFACFVWIAGPDRIFPVAIFLGKVLGLISLPALIILLVFKNQLENLGG